MINELVPLLNALPQEEKDYLVSLAKVDASLFKETLQDMLRLNVIVKTGNRRAWENWKREQEECLQVLLRELESGNRK